MSFFHRQRVPLLCAKMNETIIFVQEERSRRGGGRRMKSTDKVIEVYQLRIWIRRISPQIWRRLLVRSDSMIAELHDTLQIAFGWRDDHLHQFLIRGKPYGIARVGGIIFDDNPRQIQLRDFHFRSKETWLYEYDLTDCWQHEIRLEQVLLFNLVLIVFPFR